MRATTAFNYGAMARPGGKSKRAGRKAGKQRKPSKVRHVNVPKDELPSYHLMASPVSVVPMNAVDAKLIEQQARRNKNKTNS